MNDCITDEQGRLPCTCLHTNNHDGSSPHGEILSTVEIILMCVVMASLTFSIFAMAGFFWSMK